MSSCNNLSINSCYSPQNSHAKDARDLLLDALRTPQSALEGAAAPAVALAANTTTLCNRSNHIHAIVPKLRCAVRADCPRSDLSFRSPEPFAVPPTLTSGVRDQFRSRPSPPQREPSPSHADLCSPGCGNLHARRISANEKQSKSKIIANYSRIFVF